MTLAFLGYAALAVASAGAIGAAAGELHGYRRGEAARQAEWDQETRERVATETKSLRADRDMVQQRAAGYETRIATLQDRYERISRQRAAASRLPIVCPASGAIGDVVVPAEFARGMFNADPAEPAAAGPAASGVDYGLQRRPAAAQR